MGDKQFGADDTAVSEVRSVVLMVAITVLLAATVAAYVVGLGQVVTRNQTPTVARRLDKRHDGDLGSPGAD